MSHLHYMSLPNVGSWHRAVTDVGAQLAPYAEYLRNAQKAATLRPPVLSWEPVLASRARELDARRAQRFAAASGRASAGMRRRDRLAPAKQHAGVWVQLYPPPWNAEVPESTFKAFMSRKAEVHDRPPRPKERGAAVLDFDREARCLLLAELPTPIDEAAEASDAGGRTYVGRLLFLGANTYNLEQHLKALARLENRPSPRLAPLLALATSDARWEVPAPAAIDEGRWVFLDRPDRDGTQEQRAFVRCALGTPDFAILEGPPGSGKTTAICELVAQMAMRKKRVLLVASTHVAVDNVLERLLQKQDSAREEFVLPVRIGDEDDVTSEVVKRWLFHRLEHTWKGKIQDFLDAPRGANAFGARARDDLQRALASDASETDGSPIVRLLLESANLVCGTTVGILKHPAIKGEGFEPFDMMILDEASKTTFTEFLVPAVHARRWVIVGDVRQLSPYVDGEDLAENLRALLPSDVAAATAHAFLASKDAAPRRPSLVVCEDDATRRRLADEAGARGVAHVHLDSCDPRDTHPALLYAELVFGSARFIRTFEHRLPVVPSALTVGEAKLPELRGWRAQRAAVETHARRATADRGRATRVRFEVDDEPVDWANEVAWRLVRSFELRQNAKERTRYDQQIEGLLPRTVEDSGLQALRRRIDRTRRVAMPSVLELLQRGFERLPDKPDFGVALTDGLPPGDLAHRLVSLSHQHRMHPAISRFPRERFYADGAPAARLLQDARTVVEPDPWSYTRYTGGRATWVAVRPDGGRVTDNRNDAEVRRITRELEAFVAWARANPAHDRGGAIRRGADGRALPWEVAVLSFYGGQVEALSRALQRLAGQHANTRNFQLPSDVTREERPVHVSLCTVDGFQGHEADFVLLSFVKSGSVGFLNSPNRLNVALTRARYQLVLVGDRTFFASERCRSEVLRELAGSDCYPSDLTWETVT